MLKKDPKVETFDDVLITYEPMIYACVRRLRIYKDHEQFIQVGRIGLWNAWKRYEMERGDFAPFAYRTIYGTMLDELKKSNTNDQLLPIEDDILERLMGSPRTLHCTSYVSEAIESLNSQEQRIIQLLFIEGYTLDEVASHFRISKSGVKKRRERTLVKLRNFITKNFS